MARVVSKRRGSQYSPQEPQKTAGQYAGNILKSLSNITQMKDKMAESKISKSNLLDTVDYQFTDESGQLKQMFERAPLDSSGIPIVGDVVDYTKGAFTPAYERVQLSEKAKLAFTPKEATDMLLDKGFSLKDTDQILGEHFSSEAALMKAPRPVVPVDTDESYFIDNLDLRKSIPVTKTEELANSLNALEGSSKITEVSNELSQVLTETSDEVSNIASKAGEVADASGKVLPKAAQFAGNVGQAYGVVSGLSRAKKGFEEGDTEETIQGSIQAASPLLVKAGPVGWAVLGLNFLEDLLFD